MAYFEPLSTIYFHSGTGVDDHNKPYFADNLAMHAYFTGFTRFKVTEYSYQRADDRQFVAVDANYYDCIKCDYISFNNQGYGPTWIICKITGVEWKNPNCCWVWFEVDPFCTFCGDITWSKSYCFVEREHVTKDWNGNIPIWDSCGVPEDFGVIPEYCISQVTRMMTPNKYIVLSPYDESGEPHFTGQTRYGIYDGLSMLEFDSAGAVNSYLDRVANSDKGDINQIVGIYSIPGEYLANDPEAMNVTFIPPFDSITYHNAKLWTSNFTTISIVSNDGTSVDLKPELFTLNQYRFTFNTYFVGGSMGYRVTPQGYGLHMDSAVDVGLVYSGVPQGSFVGNAYAQWIVANKIGIMQKAINAIGAAAIAAGSAAAVVGTGGAALPAVIGSGATVGMTQALPSLGGMAGMNAANSANSIMSGMSQARKHAATVDGASGCSDLNIATAAQGYGFYLRCYQGRDSVMRRIDAYFDRFGYKVSQLKVPNRDVRPFWTYTKTSGAHITATCPVEYIKGIEAMLDGGVTFWKTDACAIGDYSNPTGNKGV